MNHRATDFVTVISSDAKVWASLSSKGHALWGSASSSAHFAEVMMTGVTGNSYQLRKTGNYDVSITFSSFEFMDWKGTVILSLNGKIEGFELPTNTGSTEFERHVEVSFAGNKWDVLKTMVVFTAVNPFDGEESIEEADIYGLQIKHRG